MSSPPKSSLGSCLVIGGCGFLGHHIVRELLADPTCTSVAVMSRSPFKNRYDGVTYFIGDIKSVDHVNLVASQVKPNVIFNTASPHAYIDHEQAPDYIFVNVDGNKNLLAAAAAVGTVKAFVYTSSGPIIAGSGGAYDHADETYPTLAVIRKGDPYHLAKALGDQLVLDANRQNGIRTACVRPTALYGEGDEQMIIPTLNVLRTGQTNIWMGYNDIEMDVVYVGHVARVELLAAHGLLTGISDPAAPKVDGEAFNVTDDQPSPPWSFFRLYWNAAGDKTPMSSVWMFPPWLVMLMANSAEFITWSTSWGRLRPKLLKKERMEFVLYTRTYSIKKARERLGFKPWFNQPWKGQEEAVKGSVQLYLNQVNGGRLLTVKTSDWPERPFKLISNTGAKSNPKIPSNHFCVKNAKLMALTHNTIFRALNAIYTQALHVTAGTQEAVDMLTYCTIVFEFIHHHHNFEETIYFPGIEKAAGIPGLMDSNIEEHRKLDEGLESFRKFSETTCKDAYSGEKLRGILDSFATVFEAHMHAEITAILDLHDKIDSETLRKIYDAMFDASEHHSDIFKYVPTCS
jgi:sterol-4alpha-carboxylate 3-dehydrogenase (decarboxylating)